MARVRASTRRAVDEVLRVRRVRLALLGRGGGGGEAGEERGGEGEEGEAHGELVGAEVEVERRLRGGGWGVKVRLLSFYMRTLW